MDKKFIYYEESLKKVFATIHQYGWQNCSPGHGYGPAVRDHFLLHFVVSGKAVSYTHLKIPPIPSVSPMVWCSPYFLGISKSVTVQGSYPPT